MPSFQTTGENDAMMLKMDEEKSLAADVAAIGQIEAVRRILEVLCRTTGMGFSVVARVTDKRWIACAVRDEIGFGLQPGSELELETTICHEIRQSRQAVAIDHVAVDPAFCGHHTPQQYGFQSYVSVPITLPDGRFFGTLCAIDPEPAKVNTPGVIGTFSLFADLIARHLDARERMWPCSGTTCATHCTRSSRRRRCWRCFNRWGKSAKSPRSFNEAEAGWPG
jgi:GAF domain-containing protein